MNIRQSQPVTRPGTVITPRSIVRFLVTMTVFSLPVLHADTTLATEDTRTVDQQQMLPLNSLPVARWNSGWALHLDNDLFSGKGKDQDYTAGATLTLNGQLAVDRAFSVDGALRWVNDKTGLAAKLNSDRFFQTQHALQIGFLLFTPENIVTPLAIDDDRPYANLVFLANSRYSLSTNQRVLYNSTLTVGLLGSSFGESLQRTVHDALDVEKANGYAHQISDGGELTARYAVARHSLLASGFSRRASYDVKLALEASVGFLTEASVALGMRWGRIQSPWWSSVSEYADYQARPALNGSALSGPVSRDTYFSAGIRLRARAYNVFLQGQFRKSDVTFSNSALEPLLLESWVGLTTNVRGLRIQYALRHQTAELRRGTGARTLTWAGISVSRSF